MAFLCLASLAGCTSLGPPAQTWTPPASLLPVEIADVPHYPQDAKQCGPAALAEVLTWSGVATTPEELSPYLYIPERGGSLQLEMLAQPRRFGRVSYELPPELSALQEELAAGHPVLVLQNNGLSWFPLWHYAVVVGVPEERVLRLRSGPHARHDISARKFLRTWRRSDYWAMVVLPPERLPASLPPEDVLAAIEAASGVLASSARREALKAAADRWPDHAAFHFALANLDYEEGNLQGSEAGFRRALRADPDDLAVRNNLAWVLGEQGRLDQAMDQIRQAREVLARKPEGQERHAAALAHTAARIRCLREATRADCS